MKSHFVFFVFALAAGAVPLVAQNVPKAPALVVNRDLGKPITITPDTSPEDEYKELARQAREADAQFQKQWDSATTPAERLKLRESRSADLEQRLSRKNLVAAKIEAKRRAKDQSASAPVSPTAAPEPDDAIKGKSKQELERMGVDVKKLHPTPSSN